MRGIFLDDSIFQFTGAYVLSLIGEFLFSNGFFLLVVAPSLIFLVHRSYKRKEWSPTLIYIAGSALIVSLFVQPQSTIQVGDVGVVAISEGFPAKEKGIADSLPDGYPPSITIPTGFRAVNAIIDGAIVGSIRTLNRSYFVLPFEFTRFNAHIRGAELVDTELEPLLGDFVDKCYIPALVKHRNMNHVFPYDLDDLMYPGNDQLVQVQYPDMEYRANEQLTQVADGGEKISGLETCGEAWHFLERAITESIQADPVHKAELERLSDSWLSQLIGAIWSGTASDRQKSYIKSVIRNSFQTSDRMMDTTNQPSLAKSPDGNWTAGWWAKQIGGGFLGVLTYLFSAPVVYGIAANVVALGPYIQGLTLMIVFSLFPFICLLSLLPGQWFTLVRYFQLVLWIKSWSLGWAVLSHFDNVKGSLGSFDEATSGLAGWTLYPYALCLVYMAVPPISGIIVSVAGSGVAKAMGGAESASGGGARKIL